MPRLKYKKILTFFLILSAVFILCSCSETNDTASYNMSDPIVPVVLNQQEYLLYQNIFYNNTGNDYVGKNVTKEGIFTGIYDAWSNQMRYYVWGYLDNTYCCDWQWELSFDDENVDLPTFGSKVTVTGTFNSSENALDGYWIEHAAITDVIDVFESEDYDYDMCTMSCTLERVQMFGILNFPELFNGKSFSAYGRVRAGNTLEDPYYNDSWYIPYSMATTSNAVVPPIGMEIKVFGTIGDGKLSDCQLRIPNNA